MSAISQDTDFIEHLTAHNPLAHLPPSKPATTALEYRAKADVVISTLSSSLPAPEGVIETKHLVESFDGTQIALHRFFTEDMARAAKPQPALLYFHGGGIVACSVDKVGRPGIARLVADMGVQAFGVEYRMAPEHPFPTPVEDCYAALRWVQANAKELNVDPSRLILHGTSGGGCLAAGVALMARDRALEPKVAKQILVYPMLDDRAATRPDSPWSTAVADSRAPVDICWDAYLGPSRRGKPDGEVSPYASPARADSLAGLPPTYIDCGTLDCFRDESLVFASKLAADEVDVELHLYPGVPHIFDLLAPKCKITLNAMDNRKRAIVSV